MFAQVTLVTGYTTALKGHIWYALPAMALEHKALFLLLRPIVLVLVY